MDNTENVYTCYDNIISEFGEETIKNRFQQILSEMTAFKERGTVT